MITLVNIELEYVGRQDAWNRVDHEYHHDCGGTAHPKEELECCPEQIFQLGDSQLFDWLMERTKYYNEKKGCTDGV